MMRLDKYLASMGFGTRNEVKKMLRKGIVAVNGEVVMKADRQIEEESDSVVVDGEEVVYQKYVYLMLNKPMGYISATKSSVANVMDLIGENFRDMFPCGRLDKDTEGLLLITNDGPLAHQLLSPKKHVEKEYYVEVEKPLSERDIQAFERGIYIDGGEYCSPAILKILGANSCTLIIHEGKFHQIKRMFAARDNAVTYLKRIRMKNLVLDENLEPGEYRYLTQEEIADLRECGN